MKNNDSINIKAVRCEGRYKPEMKRTLQSAAFILSLFYSFIFTSSCWAQTDSTKANKLSMDLQFLAHGEICAGGLPKPPTTNPDKPEADLSAFLLLQTLLK